MNTVFLDACNIKDTPYTPVWYMRQAGRYLPTYRALKKKYTILDIIKNPELSAQVALSPVNILHVDAAILFADIMIPLIGSGVELDIVENIGPVISHPIKTIRDVQMIKNLNPQENIPYLLKTISILKNELVNKVPLIGFSAAPFTLASYLIEGKPTRDFIKTKSFMYTNTNAWNILMGKLTDMIVLYLTAQVKSGVDAIQLFDSWIGTLSENDYQTYVLPYTKTIFAKLKDKKLPLIHFGTNNAGFLSSFASVSCDVVSVDWRIPINRAWEEIGFDKGIQGNLDPAVLLSDFSHIKKHVDTIFKLLPQKKGYIFNLGHGIIPSTPVKNIIQLTQYVHEKQ